ncbi:MAG: hypothetical protein ACP5F0_06355 [Sulfurihydrogenibium sp.]
MIVRYFTGIDDKGTKVNIAYDILKKDWKEVSKESKDKVYLIPADRLIYFKEDTEIENYNQILNYYKLLLEEKYPNYLYDIYVEKSQTKNTVHVMVVKDFEISSDYFALDGEIFTLKRLLELSGEKEGYVFNFDTDRITCVLVKNGSIQYYRVFKGGEEPSTVINQLPYVEKNKPVLIVGNLTKELKDEVRFLLSSSNVIEKDRKSLALACALKPIFDKDFLSFRKNEFTKEELEKLKLFLVAMLVIYIIIYFLPSYFVEKKIKDLKKLEAKIFKSAFPDVPVVSPYDQLRASVKTNLSFELSKKLSQVNLPKNSKIYSIEYFDGVLTVKGESSEPPQLSKSVKKTPSGNFEFEIEVK